MDQGSVEDAEARLDRAEAKLRQVTRMPPSESDGHPSAVVTGSQRCIEHCVKSVFILVGVQEPMDHAIPVDSEPAEQLLNAVYSELGEQETQQTARLLFLTDLYGTTYPVSEYGIDIAQLRLDADDFLTRKEGSQAYNHVAAVELTRELVDEARVRVGLDGKRREDIIGSAYSNS